MKSKAGSLRISVKLITSSQMDKGGDRGIIFRHQSEDIATKSTDIKRIIK